MTHIGQQNLQSESGAVSKEAHVVSQGVRVVYGLGAAGARRHICDIGELRSCRDNGRWRIAPGLWLPHLSDPAHMFIAV